MAATDAQIAQLRRMIGEPTSVTYTDVTLGGYIERFPRVDAFGRSPFQPSATTPPSLEANPDWQAGYDLNAAASAIWSEKASALAAKFDFSTDGQSFSRSQMYRQATDQARHYGARRSPSTITLTPSPLRNPDLSDISEAIEV